jgi:hypothetical protein
MRFATLADKQQIEDICNEPVNLVWSSFIGAPLFIADRYLTAPSRTILGDQGCFLFRWLDPGRYVVHANLLPACRGIEALEASLDALHMMFIQTDAMEILAMIPITTPQAKFVAKHLGFRYRLTRESLWPSDGELRDVEFYTLHMDDWIASTGNIRDSLSSSVRAMIEAGNADKARDTYNRIARFAMLPIVEEAQFFHREEPCLTS